MCKDIDANIYAYAKVCVRVCVCVCVAHNITVTEKGFSTQPLNPQGLVAKARREMKQRMHFIRGRSHSPINISIQK